jgi:hypothetical protein
MNNIEIFQKALDPQVCKTLIEQFENDDRVEADPQPDYSRRSFLNISLCPDWLKIMTPVIEASYVIATEYFRRPEGLEETGIYDWIDDGFIMARYNEGDDLALHVDGQIAVEPGNGLRFATQLFFLNTCEGGALHFPIQDFTVLPKAGNAVMFPPWHSHPHHVETCRSVRYVLQTWLTDPEMKVIYRS